MGAMEYGKGCGEIVLLGDIFDLWKAGPERAIRDSRHLFRRLSDLDVKISYVEEIMINIWQ